MIRKLLIVEDEETLCESLKRVLLRENYSVDTASTAEAALEVIEDVRYDLIITDIILPGHSGIHLLRRIKEKNPEQIVVVMTAYASLETAVEALRAGAYDYIVKPVMHEEIKQIVRNAINQQSLQSENLLLKDQVEGRYDINLPSVYRSQAMLNIISGLKSHADYTGNMLLSGEAGTEKNIIAKFIHTNSRRAQKPFLSLGCSEVDFRTLRKAVENASCGIIFLDNILNLSVELQITLLNHLKEEDLRLVCGEWRDVDASVNEGRFSKELFNKLAGAVITLPPLRERKEDIEPLALYFMRKYSGELCRGVTSLDPDALGILVNYNWPGNVRELDSVIARAVLLSDGEAISVKHLPGVN